MAFFSELEEVKKVTDSKHLIDFSFVLKHIFSNADVVLQ